MGYTFRGIPLHPDDEEALRPGRHFFVVLEVVRGRQSIRLKCCAPRGSSGDAMDDGQLPTLGEGADRTLRRCLGAAQVVSTPDGLELHEYSPQQMLLESMALETGLGGGPHVH